MESLNNLKMTRARKSLTQIAHDQVRAVVKPGDVVIDATAGNGHDTLFLAEIVGPQGIVYSFDIQPIAIERTRQRIEERYADQPRAELILVCDDHAVMREFIPEEHKRQVACVMFNLGYLPSGDKSLVTSLASTKQAIVQAASLLACGGCLSVLAYTGHDGGQEEADAVAALLRELCSVNRGELKREPEIDVPRSPILYFARMNHAS